HADFAIRSLQTLQAPHNLALLSAAKGGNLSEINNQLKQGADPNAKDQNGDTFLHLAAKANIPLKAPMILAGKKIDVNAQNVGGATPLHWAAMNGNVNNVRDLLIQGAYPNIRDSSGKTPLDNAKENHRTEVIKILENYNPAGA